MFHVLEVNSLGKNIFKLMLVNSLCFPTLEKRRSTFPVYSVLPMSWQSWPRILISLWSARFCLPSVRSKRKVEVSLHPAYSQVTPLRPFCSSCADRIMCSKFFEWHTKSHMMQARCDRVLFTTSLQLIALFLLCYFFFHSHVVINFWIIVWMLRNNTT